jgi:hypothetical protein
MRRPARIPASGSTDSRLSNRCGDAASAGRALNHKGTESTEIKPLAETAVVFIANTLMQRGASL